MPQPIERCAYIYSCRYFHQRVNAFSESASTSLFDASRAARGYIHIYTHARERREYIFKSTTNVAALTQEKGNTRCLRANAPRTDRVRNIYFFGARARAHFIVRSWTAEER